jgi:hypothetical protein
MRPVIAAFFMTAALCLSAFADDPGRLEMGTIISNGMRVSTIYHTWKNHDTEVHLVFPDGSNIEITVAAGTSTLVMDKSLARIADKYTASR